MMEKPLQVKKQQKSINTKKPLIEEYLSKNCYDFNCYASFEKDGLRHVVCTESSPTDQESEPYILYERFGIVFNLKGECLYGEDKLGLSDSYYEWELCDDGENQIWYECRDFQYRGKPIILFKDEDGDWAIIFDKLREEYSEKVASTEMYLKDNIGHIIVGATAKEIAKYAEEHIKENKNKFERKVEVKF